jgi:Putative polyhydroxyalkanoic acid system protein (PHA_gran_rgn)
MKHTVPHGLDDALARRTVEKALASYRQKYPHAKVDLSWNDESSATLVIGAKGVEVKGEVAITGSNFTFDFNVPLLLRPFKSKALEVIDREVNVWIGRAKAGELA